MDGDSESVGTSRRAKVQILICLAFSAIWVQLVRWNIFAGNAPGAVAFLLASLLLIPTATAFALVATATLFAARTVVHGTRKLSHTGFLILGAILSAIGIATCARIIYGITMEG
jgi:hypothetical protein